MSDWKKSVFPAIGVIATIAAFIGGSEIRTRQDTGLAVRKIPQSYLAGIESPSETAVNVPEGELFYQLLLLLERDYVDPKIDEQKLAYGAVKGMVEGLWDPLSQFLQKDHFEEHERRLTGNFGGAGMEMRMISDGTELAKVQRGGRSSDPLLLRPILQVATVVPGGPADVAGIQVGDQILGVNQKWILGYTDVVKVRGLQKSLASGKISAVEFDRERGEFQKRAKSAISIARAENLLDMGEGKIVPLTWSRGGREMSATLTTKATKLTMLEKSPDGSYRLRLFKGVSKDLGSLDATNGEITIDLRQSTLGDPTELVGVLEHLAPAGKFGQILSQRSGQPRTLATTKGAPDGRHYKLIVDKSTRGAAEILALALKARGLAEIVGGPMASEPVWIETTALGDGSGYTLNTGRFASSSLEARK